MITEDRGEKDVDAQGIPGPRRGRCGRDGASGRGLRSMEQTGPTHGFDHRSGPRRPPRLPPCRFVHRHARDRPPSLRRDSQRRARLAARQDTVAEYPRREFRLRGRGQGDGPPVEGAPHPAGRGHKATSRPDHRPARRAGWRAGDRRPAHRRGRPRGSRLHVHFLPRHRRQASGSRSRSKSHTIGST